MPVLESVPSPVIIFEVSQEITLSYCKSHSHIPVLPISSWSKEQKVTMDKIVPFNKNLFQNIL